MESLDKKVHIKWEEMSNGRIKEKLSEISHEHITIKNKINTLLDRLDYLDKEYLIGDTVANNRMKGIG